MEVSINPDLLTSLGYRSMTRAQVSDVLDSIYETLELRVGKRLAEQMDDNQLATFQRLIEGNEERKALEWLSSNKPHYKDVVQDEFDHIVRVLERTAAIKGTTSAESGGEQTLAGTEERA